jgi:hypothetical protein
VLVSVSAPGVLLISRRHRHTIRPTVLQNIVTVWSFPFGAAFASIFY